MEPPLHSSDQNSSKQEGQEEDSSIWVNYFYFGLLFFLLVILCISSIFSREDLGGSRLFFLVYSLGQATLEVLCFIFCGWLIRRSLSKFWFSAFIGMTFFSLLLHLADFLLDRFLHFTLWETIEFVFDESFKNFLNMLDASGIPLWLWICSFAFVLFIPIIGILIYLFTEWLAKKHPFGLSLEMILQAIFCIPVALFLWDWSASHMIHRESHYAFIKSLPWKMTFFHPDSPNIILSQSLMPPSSEEETQKKISQFDVPPKHRPNIYLFIVESLRSDFIDPEMAPVLSNFRDQTIHADLSLSNANATQISWFSIFHSNFPYYWKVLQENNWKSGSPALQLLRAMGYDLHVYTSANLDYYGMDRLLFGEKQELLSSFKQFLHPFPKEAWKSDQETIEAFAKDIVDPRLQQGQCFIFFWDATHFDYSWPKQQSKQFSPIAKDMNYFQAYLCKKKIEAIKNRYRNAVHFIDSLFGSFLSIVPNRKEALICFTGDHGEEFFEHGHLFHLSQLCDVQTQVPLYFQLPRTPKQIPDFLSHMDIFPTLIDALEPNCSIPLAGQSLFQEKRWPFVVLARYNASRTPSELCLHNGMHKLTFRFSKKDIFRSHLLKILSLRTKEDLIFEDYKKNISEWVHHHFDDAFSRIMSSEEKSSKNSEAR